MTKHISSEAIDGMITYFNTHTLAGPAGVPAIKQRMGQTEVGFPAFGVVGLPLHAAYGSARGKVEAAFDEVKKSIEDYVLELGKAKESWINAENANTVVAAD